MTKREVGVYILCNYFCSRWGLGDGWQYEPLTVPFAHSIIIKEINIKASLYKASNPTNPVDISFYKVAVDPIEDIKESICAHGKDKM